MQRIGRWRFPVYEFVHDGHTTARLGRTGLFKIYFGSGQRIELVGGGTWWMTSMTVGGTICPVVRDDDGRKVAVAGMTNRTYGINTRDQAYLFYPTNPKQLGRARWMLTDHENELAIVMRRAMTVEASEPVPLGVAMLCIVLARYGVVGETAPRLPAFTWGKA